MNFLRVLFAKEMRFKTLFFLFGELFLVSLCCWQLQRLSWKENLLKAYDHMALSPKPFTGTYSQEPENSDTLYEKITFKGRVDPQALFKLVPRKGTIHDTKGRPQEVLGYHLLLPLNLKEGRVLLELGWFEADVPLKEIQKHLLNQEMQFEGVLMPAQTPKTFTPSNALEEKTIYVIDEKFLGSDDLSVTLKSHYIRVLKSKKIVSETFDGGDEAIYALTLPERPENRHLSYALTWGTLAFLWVLVFWIYVRQHLKAQ